jgi:hypothetical protein
MEKLGLDPNTPKPTSRLRELLWPDVSEIVAAQTVARNGMYAGFLISGLTSLFAVTGVTPRLSLFDGLLFLAIAIGIRRMSRVAAVLGLVLYLIEQGDAIVHGRGTYNVVLLVLVSAIFLASVRATFSFHRLRAELRGRLSDPEATAV